MKKDNNYYKWTKKLDKMHLSKKGKCLCGKACLGNNYATEFPDREICKECEKEAHK